MKPIAILYEHPEWFKPLFAELDRLGVSYVALYAAEHVYDPDASEVPYSLIVNRMTPSPRRTASCETRFPRHASASEQ